VRDRRGDGGHIFTTNTDTVRAISANFNVVKHCAHIDLITYDNI